MWVKVFVADEMNESFTFSLFPVGKGVYSTITFGLFHVGKGVCETLRQEKLHLQVYSLWVKVFVPKKNLVFGTDCLFHICKGACACVCNNFYVVSNLFYFM